MSFNILIHTSQTNLTSESQSKSSFKNHRSFISSKNLKEKFSSLTHCILSVKHLNEMSIEISTKLRRIWSFQIFSSLQLFHPNCSTFVQVFPSNNSKKMLAQFFSQKTHRNTSRKHHENKHREKYQLNPSQCLNPKTLTKCLVQKSQSSLLCKHSATFM